MFMSTVTNAEKSLIATLAPPHTPPAQRTLNELMTAGTSVAHAASPSLSFDDWEQDRAADGKAAVPTANQATDGQSDLAGMCMPHIQWEDDEDANMVEESTETAFDAFIDLDHCSSDDGVYR